MRCLFFFAFLFSPALRSRRRHEDWPGAEQRRFSSSTARSKGRNTEARETRVPIAMENRVRKRLVSLQSNRVFRKKEENKSKKKNKKKRKKKEKKTKISTPALALPPPPALPLPLLPPLRVRRHRRQPVPYDQPQGPQPDARAPLLQVQRRRVEDGAAEVDDGDLEHCFRCQDPDEEPVAHGPGQHAPALVPGLAGVALVEELHADEGVEDDGGSDEVGFVRRSQKR